MPRKKQNHKFGNCEECGVAIKLKPADRKFCAGRCRYRHNNRVRPKPDGAFAIAWVSDNLITIPQAVALGYGKETTLRSKIKRGEMKGIRLFGRVLVEKREGK